jgi:hypothetical protein
MWEERKRGKCERKGKKEENKVKRETKCTIGQNLRGKRCMKRKLGLLGESKKSFFRGGGGGIPSFRTDRQTPNCSTNIF